MDAATNDRQRAKIVEWLKAILAPDQIVEVRALHPVVSRTFATGVTGELENLAAFAASQSSVSKGVYFTPNPLRSINGSGKGGANLDRDVIRRNWLLIDIDPARPKDTNATDAEREAGRNVCESILSTLTARGFGGIVQGDSGNGYHLMVPVDLPNDDASRVMHREFLKHLHERFSTSDAGIDKSTHNAGRIWKLPGTIAMKGPHSADRPHRYARLLECPADHRRFCDGNLTVLKKLLSDWGAGRKPADADSYGRKALNEECGKILTAVPHDPVNGRNTQLNTSAFNLGQLVAGGEIDRVVAEAALIGAGVGAGLPEAEVRDVVSRAMLAGAASPRSAGGTAGQASANGQQPAQPVIGQPKKEIPWDKPVELTDDPMAEPFPVDVFPPILSQFIIEGAWALNVPRDYFGVTLLAMAGGAIGNSRRLFVKNSYHQSAAIYAAFVGRPGTKKNPVLAIASKPLSAAEERFSAAHDAEVSSWKQSGQQGPMPHRRRVITTGGTVEGIVRRLATNRRGILMVTDELSGVIAGLNQYKAGGKGNDRQFYLSAWDQTSYIMERVEEEKSIFVPRPFLSIAGAIQPDTLAILKGETENNRRPPPDDGFFDRFLVSYPAPCRAEGETWRDIGNTSADGWAAAINGLLSLVPNADGTPIMVRMGGAARAAYQQFTEADAAEINDDDFPQHLQGPWSKLAGYSVRFALIMHLLDQVCDGVSAAELDESEMQRAVRLVAYFKSHARKAHQLLGGDPRVDKARLIVSWIVSSGGRGGLISRRDVWRGLRRSFERPEQLDRPMELLVQTGHLRVCEPPERSANGRPMTTLFKVHPEILSTP